MESNKTDAPTCENSEDSMQSESLKISPKSFKVLDEVKISEIKKVFSFILEKKDIANYFLEDKSTPESIKNFRDNT